MARLNPKRRLLLKLREWDKQAHDLTVQYNDDSKLQQGAVRSGLAKFENKVGRATPPSDWGLEGTGSRKRSSTKRWAKL